MTFNTPINNNFMLIFNLWFYLNIRWNRNSLTYKMRVSKVHQNYLKIDQTKGNAQGASGIKAGKQGRNSHFGPRFRFFNLVIVMQQKWKLRNNQ